MLTNSYQPGYHYGANFGGSARTREFFLGEPRNRHIWFGQLLTYNADSQAAQWQTRSPQPQLISPPATAK
jgi:hypothetical protein